MKFLHIPTIGDPRVVECDNNESYATLSGIVGGPLEGVAVGDHILYVHEEGKLRGLPLNLIATEITREFLAPWDAILGDAVLAGPPGEEGEDTDVSDEWIEAMTTLPPESVSKSS